MGMTMVVGEADASTANQISMAPDISGNIPLRFRQPANPLVVDDSLFRSGGVPAAAALA